MNINSEEIIQEIVDEVSKCNYCGFCEWVCTTYRVTKNRYFSPRGRVNLIKLALMPNSKSELNLLDIVDSIYTCVLCRACETQCPIGIKITKVVMLCRSLILRMMSPTTTEK